MKGRAERVGRGVIGQALANEAEVKVLSACEEAGHSLVVSVIGLVGICRCPTIPK